VYRAPASAALPPAASAAARPAARCEVKQTTVRPLPPSLIKPSVSARASAAAPASAASPTSATDIASVASAAAHASTASAPPAKRNKRSQKSKGPLFVVEALLDVKDDENGRQFLIRWYEYESTLLR
jgi:hypothetical protein